MKHIVAITDYYVVNSKDEYEAVGVAVEKQNNKDRHKLRRIDVNPPDITLEEVE